MSDVVNLGGVRAGRSGSNKNWTPVECLQDAIDEIKSGEVPVTAVLVLMLEKSDDSFFVGWAASNLQGSEMLSVAECFKASMLRDMGYT